ncbi:hypothetical protein L6452_33817 [Arctium lappa]|uniref:Uncharacterized protein n=1 Tax=Arctium lappa TaxID=4217 RepID=A0ACB8YH30_ARCLA|nr:hypothetical protein L6452_33817 [Arctium lappa]
MRNENVEVNIIIWNTVASGYLKTGNYTRVLKLLSQFRASGDQWDPVAVINGLNACSHIGALKLGKEIHGLAIRTCCHAYDNVKNALITMYSSKAFEMYELLDGLNEQLKEAGYIMCDDEDEAMEAYRIDDGERK